ncbi:hypothetical protein MDAP_001077 [Mitosporidium daphniae]
MNTYEKRLESFTLNRWPLDDSPDQKYSVELFAAAGFYFSPTQSHPDATSCYCCAKDLDGWEPEDDPWMAHIKHGRMPKKTAIRYFSSLQSLERRPDHIKKNLSSIIAGLRSGPDEVACPLVTMHLERSRLFSFTSGWPHKDDGLQEFKASPFSLAASGFFFYPSLSSNDQVVCYQCGLALSGWEPDDDPWFEHCKRRPECLHIKGSPAEPYSFTSIFSTCPSLLPISPNASITLIDEGPKYRLITAKMSNETSDVSHDLPSVEKSRKKHTFKPKVRRSQIFSQNAQNTPVSASRIKEIIQKSRDSNQFKETDEPDKNLQPRVCSIDSRQSGPIMQPYCSLEEFEKISSMTVGTYVEWIGNEIVHVFDRITNGTL